MAFFVKPFSPNHQKMPLCSSGTGGAFCGTKCIFEIYYLNVLQNGKKVWIWRQKIFKWLIKFGLLPLQLWDYGGKINSESLCHKNKNAEGKLQM